MRAFLVLLLASLVGCHTDRVLPPPFQASDAGAGEGLPCDVAAVLAANCLACHGATPTAGAPMSLTSREELLAPSFVNPAKTFAQRSVIRMRDASNPMPPGRQLPEEDIAVIEAWVNAGAPVGECGDVADAGPPPIPDSPPGCESNQFWRDGDDGDEEMHPGLPCIACHLSTDEEDDDMPTTLGGTVYPKLREFDDCYGVEGITVEITDASGRVISRTSNNAGNFFYDGPLVTPYRARLIDGDRVREMLTPQTSGDCNSCHTQEGLNGAPGRIVAP